MKLNKFRRGVDLTDVLVFIAVLAFLCSLILPAISKLREPKTEVPMATGEITAIRGSLSLAVNTPSGTCYIDVVNGADGPQTVGNLGVKLKIGDTIEFPLTKPDKKTSLFSPEGFGVLNANDIKVRKSRPTTSPVEK